MKHNAFYSNTYVSDDVSITNKYKFLIKNNKNTIIILIILAFISTIFITPLWSYQQAKDINVNKSHSPFDNIDPTFSTRILEENNELFRIKLLYPLGWNVDTYGIERSYYSLYITRRLNGNTVSSLKITASTYAPEIEQPYSTSLAQKITLPILFRDRVFTIYFTRDNRTHMQQYFFSFPLEDLSFHLPADNNNSADYYHVLITGKALNKSDLEDILAILKSIEPFEPSPTITGIPTID